MNFERDGEIKVRNSFEGEAYVRSIGIWVKYFAISNTFFPFLSDSLPNFKIFFMYLESLPEFSLMEMRKAESGELFSSGMVQLRFTLLIQAKKKAG